MPVSLFLLRLKNTLALRITPYTQFSYTFNHPVRLSCGKAQQFSQHSLKRLRGQARRQRGAKICLQEASSQLTGLRPRLVEEWNYEGDGATGGERCPLLQFHRQGKEEHHGNVPPPREQVDSITNEYMVAAASVSESTSHSGGYAASATDRNLNQNVDDASVASFSAAQKVSEQQSVSSATCLVDPKPAGEGTQTSLHNVPIRRRKGTEPPSINRELVKGGSEEINAIIRITRNQTRRISPYWQKGRSPQQRRLRHNPTWLLFQWLDKEHVIGNEKWETLCKHLSAPQTVLLRHIFHLLSPKSIPNESELPLENEAAATLARQGFAERDLQSWAWVLSGKDLDVMAERYLCLRHPKPSFLLSIILRKPISQVQTLRALLLDVWGQMQNAVSGGQSGVEESQLEPSKLSQEKARVLEPADYQFVFTEASFIALLRRLLDQARRIWPPAIVSLAQMFKAYYLSGVRRGSQREAKLDRQRHALLCRRYNQMICMLALPASINPLKSMVYNWMAQRVILEMGSQFEPRLILDSNSYRALIRVLAASKKSERESESTVLRRREWPPWTVERSGMDAQRSLEEDFSRVVLAATSMRGAGYVENAGDVAMKILGGQEVDGTPTILTRAFVKPQANYHGAANDMRLDPEIWAARIRATRDVQEAWSAFTAFENEGGKASLPLFFAMFEKLNSEAARNGQLRVQDEMIPGDSKEVMPPLRDNFTAYYQSRLQPPSLDTLYAGMIDQGIKPAGRCLVFLVRHARTLSEGLQFLRDSGKDESAIAYLGGFSKDVRSDIVGAIPHSLYAAFIELLCRSSPRAEAVAYDLEAGVEPSAAVEGVTVSANSKGQSLPSVSPIRWETHHLRLPSGLQDFDPLQHAITLLHRRRCKRQAWYAVFQTLARQGAVIDHRKPGEPENDILSWQILQTLWHDFSTSRGELDPQGFRIICHGFEKALLAVRKGASYDRAHISAAFARIKDEFRRLCDTSEDSALHHLPVLLHPLEGAHLHIYARVAGLLEDYAELLFILRWMTRNHEALYEGVLQARNGRNLLRRAIVAIKVFVSETDCEGEAMELVESVESWGGWPSEAEVEMYINH